MMRYCLYPLVLTLSLILYGCEPYNSSKANKDLLQGRWLLLSQTYSHPDSIKDNLLRDTLYLTFTNDSIRESINSHFNQMYSYNIKGYEIDWEIENSIVSKAKIVKLKNDTFMMRTYDYLWIYRRIE